MTKCLVSRTTILIITVCLIQNTFAQRKLIHCGSVLDGINPNPQAQMTIVIDGNKILEIK